MLFLDWINISLFIVIIAYLLLGGLIFIKGKNRTITNGYLLIILSVVLWTLAMILFRSAQADPLLLFTKLLYISATFIASVFFIFSLIFPEGETPSQRTLMIVTILNLTIIVAILIPDFIIQQTIFRPGQEPEIIWGRGYILYFLYITGFFTLGLFQLYQKYRHKEVILTTQKNQLFYVMIGYAASSIPAMITNLLLPWLGVFSLNWLGQIFAVLVVVFTAYAVIRYRFMDIRIAIRQIIVYFGTALFAYFTFFCMQGVYAKLFENFFSAGAFVFGIFVALIFVFLFYAVKNFLKKSTRKYLFPALSQYQEAIYQLSKDLSQYTDLDELTQVITNTIYDKMEISRVGIMLQKAEASSSRKNPQTLETDFFTAKVINFRPADGFHLIKLSPLIKRLERTGQPVVREEIELIAKNLGLQKNANKAQNSKIKNQRKELLDLKDIMGAVEAALCLPLIAGPDLIGFIFLGAKNNQKSYTKNDIEMLSTLASQAAVALAHAQRIKQIEELQKYLKNS